MKFGKGHSVLQAGTTGSHQVFNAQPSQLTQSKQTSVHLYYLKVPSGHWKSSGTYG